MTNKTIDQLILDLQAACVAPKGRKNAADVYRALERGEDLRAVKTFDYNGVKLTPGMVIRLEGGRWDKQLIEQGFFTTEDAYNTGQRVKAAREVHERVFPIVQRLTEARAEIDLHQAHIPELQEECKRLEAEAMAIVSEFDFTG